jgi:hypothetical protein
MRRRRRLVVGAGVLALLDLAGVFLVPRLLPDPPPGVCRANFHRLYVGMPSHEVEALFGGPGKPPIITSGYVDLHDQGWANEQRDRGIVVSYDDDWRLEHAMYIDSGRGIDEELPSKDGPLTHLLRLLGW